MSRSESHYKNCVSFFFYKELKYSKKLQIIDRKTINYLSELFLTVVHHRKEITADFIYVQLDENYKLTIIAIINQLLKISE